MDWQDFEAALAALNSGLRMTLRTNLASIWLPIQLAIVVAVAATAYGIASLVRKRFDLVSATMEWPPYVRLAARVLISHLGAIIFIVLLSIVRVSMRASMERPRTYLLMVAIDLVSAWVVINVVAGLIKNQFVNRVVTVLAWTVAALSILRLLDPIVSGLNSITLNLGGLRITPLVLLKAALLMVLLVWAAVAASNFLDKRLRGFSDLTPSIQVLLSKLIRIGLLTFAIIIALSSLGIDLSVLAVFTGAVGVGLGFGLQKIVSNLVSGIILLADKSIKPGDVISVGDQYGWVTTMGARYTAVDTRDGREYLVPERGLHHPARGELVVLQQPDPPRSEIWRQLFQRSAQGAGRGSAAAASVQRVLEAAGRRSAICWRSASRRSNTGWRSGSAIRAPASPRCAATSCWRCGTRWKRKASACRSPDRSA